MWESSWKQELSIRSGTVVHTCNPRTRHVEAEGSSLQSPLDKKQICEGYNQILSEHGGNPPTLKKQSPFNVANTTDSGKKC